MEFSGEEIIGATTGQVWAALNSTDVLQQCIPGCESIQQVGENELAATVLTKVGPIKARFTGKVRLSDLVPEQSYTISGEGNGGAAGLVRGQAHVTLEPHDDGTRLTYRTDSQIMGKIAQIGARLIDGMAQKTAEEFFTRLKAVLESQNASPPATSETQQEQDPGVMPTDPPKPPPARAANLATPLVGLPSVADLRQTIMIALTSFATGLVAGALLCTILG
jgi:carbon monoxide dehydrogenase subunit G